MKVKVSKNIKGRLSIPVLKKSLPPETEIFMNEEEFFDSSTQHAIRAGHLIVTEPCAKPNFGKEFKSIYKNRINIKTISRGIDPGEIFFVPQSKVDNQEIATLLTNKWITEDVEPLPSGSVSKEELQNRLENLNKNTSKGKDEKTKKENKRKVKSEEKEESPTVDPSKDIFIPENAIPSKLPKFIDNAPKPNAPEEETEDEDDDMFVDKRQEKEKMLERPRKIKINLSEDNGEVI